VVLVGTGHRRYQPSPLTTLLTTLLTTPTTLLTTTYSVR
jgi:hypothetical protein